MNWFEAMILGLVEGLTEYLPVSSTGHLILAQRAMGIPQSEAADAYAICIQAGAIVAVLGLYWRRVVQMLRGIIGRDLEGRRLLVNLVAAFVPAMVFGLQLNATIKKYLFGLWPIVAAWALGGAAILWVTRRRLNSSPSTGGQGGVRGGSGERNADAILRGQGESMDDDGSTLPQPLPEREGSKTLAQLTWQLALIIGLLQCIAMWPGVSRSLITIVGGLLVGLRLAAAVEFSFLLGVMTLGAATCYDGLKHGQVMINTYGIDMMLIGFLFAFISAALAVKWMVAYLQKHSLAIFGWYRVGLAAIVAVLIVMGKL
ncbi:MAG: undecaprenyl-diphosphate phosphatase [Phycisphaeraceae bacterium]